MAYPEIMFDDLDNMSDDELKIKELIRKTNGRINTALNKAKNYSVGSCERLQYLQQAKAFTDSLGDIIFTFDGSHKIYQQMLESGEVQKI